MYIQKSELVINDDVSNTSPEHSSSTNSETARTPFSCSRCDIELLNPESIFGLARRHQESCLTGIRVVSRKHLQSEVVCNKTSLNVGNVIAGKNLFIKR